VLRHRDRIGANCELDIAFAIAPDQEPSTLVYYAFRDDMVVHSVNPVVIETLKADILNITRNKHFACHESVPTHRVGRLLDCLGIG